MSDKQSVIDDYQAAYAEFRSSVDGLGEDQMERPFLDVWSVREVVGHIAGWHDQMTLGLQRMAQGQRPTPEGVDWGDTQGFNARFAQDVSGTSPSELLRRLDIKVHEFIAALQALPDDRFGEGKTVNRMAAGAGYEHFREHADDINQARAEGKL